MEGNYFEITNELIYFIVLNLLLLLIGDIISDVETRYNLGWIIVLLVLSFIVLNFTYLFVIMTISLVKYTRIYYRRLKMMIAMRGKVKKLFQYHQ